MWNEPYFGDAVRRPHLTAAEATRHDSERQDCVEAVGKPEARQSVEEHLVALKALPKFVRNVDQEFRRSPHLTAAAEVP